MRKLRVLPAVLLAVVVVPLAAAAPAQAKGPTSVDVVGPGIDTESLDYTERRGDVDLNTLVRTTGIFGLFHGGRLVPKPELSESELGPRYVLTWGVGRSALTISHVYPFADGGAWVYHGYSGGGWFRAGPGLERAMVDLGAGVPKVKSAAASITAPAPASAPAAATPETETSSTNSSHAWLSAVAGFVVLGGAAVWWVRRRRTPQLG